MMKRYVWVLFLMVPDFALAQNREASLDLERGASDIRALEKESGFQRDLLGRKVVIESDSKIDPNSLSIDAAPGSTVVIRARQYDKGVQTTDTPLFKNVELPN